MSTKKSMVKLETIPYLTLWDINKEWLDLKVKRGNIWDSIREQRKEMTNLTYKINDIEIKMAEVITKLGNKVP